ncbi:hypothetical protein AHAS_Ahas13G0389000 [Arachis hypogaea]
MEVEVCKSKVVATTSSHDKHNRKKDNYWESIELIKQKNFMAGGDGLGMERLPFVQTYLPLKEAIMIASNSNSGVPVVGMVVNPLDPSALDDVRPPMVTPSNSPKVELASNCMGAELWPNIKRLAEHIQGDWCIKGDFNCVLSSIDIGGSTNLSRDHHRFSSYLLDSGLLDVGFQGHPFTWQRGNIRRKLDRYVANNSWSQRFSNALAKHLLKLKPNHVPILLDMNYYGNSFACLFRFLASWLAHEDFKMLLRNNWFNKNLLEENISYFMTTAKVWN